MTQPTKLSTAQPSLPAVTASAILDWLKPPRSEAIARLRANTLGLLTLTILTNLLPLPSPSDAITVLRQRTPAGSLYYSICAIEVLFLAVLGLNILQASYALRYPRASPVPPPPSSPAKSLNMSPPASRQWHLKGSSPNSSRQKAFTYAASPVSTPSRTLNYTIPPSASSPLDSSFTSSIGSVPPSPSSPLAAYRGRHSTAAGHAFDGSLLSRLAQHDSDDDENEDD